MVWDTLLDPEKLAAVIPGCHSLDRVSDNSYKAEVSLGVGPVRGRFHDLQAALESLGDQLDHVLPLSLQMEPLELNSSEARQSARIWTLTILV